MSEPTHGSDQHEQHGPEHQPTSEPTAQIDPGWSGTGSDSGTPVTERVPVQSSDTPSSYGSTIGSGYGSGYGSTYGEATPPPPSSEGAWSTGSYGTSSAEPAPYGGPGAATGAATGAGAGASYGWATGPAQQPATQQPYPQQSYGQQPHAQQPYGQPGQPAQPGQPWGGQPGTWPGATPAAPRTPGFLGNLLDTSFDRFVTPVVAKVAYLVVIVAVGLSWVAQVVGTLITRPLYGLVVLVVGGVIALVTVIGARVLIEAVLALVRLAEDTRVIRDHLTGSSAGSTSTD